ncbi:MAG: MFS transporter [Desulfitobacteriaceae bacterium]|nr:MFS transporter [Desulfitobacteriaceae bacterium]
MDDSKPKLWTKDFIIISFANFFVALTFYILMTSLTVYAVEQFNVSESRAGFATSIFVIGALFSRLFAGKYIELIGRKKLLRANMLLFFISSLLYYPVNELNLLLVIRFVHGAAFGAVSTAMSTIVLSMLPNERRGEGTSYFSLSVTCATAIGPFLGIFITQHADFNMIFLFCNAISAIGFITCIFADVTEAKLTKEQRQGMKSGFMLLNFLEIKALPISVIMFFMGIAYSGIITFINSYAIEIQLTDAAGLFFIVYSICLFISRPLAGILLDRKGDNIVIYPAILLFSLGLVLLSQAEHGFTMLLAGALVALGYGTLISSAQAIAVKVSPKYRIGLAISTLFIFMDAGMGIGPLLTGILVPRVGYRGMYLTLAVIVFLTVILYYFAHGKNTASKYRNSSGYLIGE